MNLRELREQIEHWKEDNITDLEMWTHEAERLLSVAEEASVIMSDYKDYHNTYMIPLARLTFLFRALEQLETDT